MVVQRANKESQINKVFLLSTWDNSFYSFKKSGTQLETSAFLKIDSREEWSRSAGLTGSAGQRVVLGVYTIQKFIKKNFRQKKNFKIFDQSGSLRISCQNFI